MQFDYNNQLMPMNSIEVEEIGNCALEAWNDAGFYYYLILKTNFGTSTLFTCGPVLPDITTLPSGFKITLDKMQYREDKLFKSINYFLNDTKKEITNAQIVDVKQAAIQFRDLQDYILNFNEDTF